MPSDIVGTYSLPAGYLATAGTTILTTQHNPIFQDVAQGLTDRIMANGAKAMTGELTLSGNPATALGAAPKQYVDAQALAAVAALDIKPSVVAATTGNITLSAPQTIDGVSVIAADRVLVKNQTAPAENGIYIVGAAGWSRATDMDAWTEVPGAIVAVEGGTQWQDTLWLCTANAGGTIGTTAMTWRRFDTNVLRNAQTGTTYTVLADDHGRHITTSNAGAIATTLPQATGNFGFGFSFIIENLGAGANTITPTTSTINGAATLVVRTGEAFKVTSDGTNYRAIPYGLSYGILSALTEDTSPDLTNDFTVTLDVSALAFKKVKPSNLVLPISTQAELEAASVTTSYATPGRMQYHPGVAKLRVKYDQSSGTATVGGTSYNLSSLTDGATGLATANLTTAMSDANCHVTGSTQRPSTNNDAVFSLQTGNSPTTTTIPVATTIAAVNADMTYTSVVAHGDQ